MSAGTDLEKRTLTIQRTFNAPVELVFSAWTKPEHLVRWFGPNDFTLPTCEHDFRVGGKFRICMRAPDGSDHWVRGEYLEIDPPHKLAFSWIRNDAEPDPWVDNVVTVTFEELDGRTHLTMHQALFATMAFRDEHRGGWIECLDRLATFITSIRPS